MAVINSVCYKWEDELKELLLENRQCFFYTVFDKLNKKLIIDVCAENKNFHEWTEEKVFEDFARKTDMLVYSICFSKFIQSGDLVTINITAHTRKHEFNIKLYESSDFQKKCFAKD